MPHLILEDETNRKLIGGTLFYRTYPFRPRESFSAYLENNVSYLQSRNWYINGGDAQEVYRLTESILLSLRYKFLNRCSVYAAWGPALTFYYGGIEPFQFNNGEEYHFIYKPNYHYNVRFGLEIGIM